MGKLSKHLRVKKTAKPVAGNVGSVPHITPNDGLISHQFIQNAIQDPTPHTLTPEVILSLQRSHGNQFVQRLLNNTGHSKSPPPNTNAIKVGAAPITIQRRVPRPEILDELLKDDHPDALRNRKKMTRVINRIIKELEPQEFELLKTYLQHTKEKMPEVLEETDGTKIKAFVSILKKVFAGKTDDPRDLIHPGRESSFVTPQKGEEISRMAAAVEKGAKILRLLESGNAADKYFQDVFGIEEIDGGEAWKIAKSKLPAAADWLERLFQQGKLGGDMSKESKQVGTLGVTIYNKMILLSEETYQKVLQPGKEMEAAIVLMHESLHAAHMEIKDNGGYIKGPGFESRSTEAKLKNAAHYEEVFRRLMNLEPQGGVFKPGIAKEGAPPTKIQEGVDTAVRALLGAHTRANSAHHWLKEGQAEQSKGQEISNPNALLYMSSVEGWTLHKRWNTNLPFPQITDLDLVLSEGVTRKIFLAYSAAKNYPTEKQTWLDADYTEEQLSGNNAKKLISEKVLSEALRGVGPIRVSLERDIEMVMELLRVTADRTRLEANPVRLNR